jgi:hypothetical protein
MHGVDPETGVPGQQSLHAERAVEGRAEASVQRGGSGWTDAGVDGDRDVVVLSDRPVPVERWIVQCGAVVLVGDLAEDGEAVAEQRVDVGWRVGESVPVELQCGDDPVRRTALVASNQLRWAADDSADVQPLHRGEGLLAERVGAVGRPDRMWTLRTPQHGREDLRPWSGGVISQFGRECQGDGSHR